MKQLFFFFVLLLPFCVQAQISEPFDGPEITSANPWKVGEGFHLSGGRLSFDGSGQKGWKSCALPIRYTPDMQWTFDVDLAFRSSNLNNARIYVYATAKPSDVAFFVQVGHNDHSVSFYEYRGTNTPERVIRGREGLLGDGASSVRVRLTLERNRLWTLYTSTDKRHFVKEGEVEIPLPAEDIRPGGFFHLACFYKAISLTGMVFSFDNVEISSEIDLSEADPGEEVPEVSENPGEASGKTPALLSVEEETDFSLLLAFDREIRAANALVFLSGEEAEVLYLSEDERILKAEWATLRERGKRYTLDYAGIYPKEGIEESKGSRSFVSRMGGDGPDIPREPSGPGRIARGELVINEILARPDRDGFPEYVELLNTSSGAIDVGGCFFWNGKKRKELPDAVIPAGGYALLYHPDRPVREAGEAVLIPVEKFPPLNDSGKTLRLEDPFGTVVDQVTYEAATAGRSWERSGQGCHLSSDPRGGTPGAPNSSGELPPVDPGEPEEPDEPDPDPGESVTVLPGEIVFNELLPEPNPGGSEYVELYNRSDRRLPLAGLFVATRKSDGRLGTRYPLSPITSWLEPGGYALLSKHLEGVRDFYLLSDPDVLHELRLPILANTSAVLVLAREEDGEVIDEVAYSRNWHLSAVKGKKGVALERIDPDGATQDPSNWISASSTHGYGTPGYRNSQYGADRDDVFSGIEPPVYSETTREYTIAYRLDQPGYTCRAWVFDLSGRQMCEVSNLDLLGSEGELSWNGLAANGGKVKAGVYIFYAELAHPTGKVERYKRVFLVR